MKLVIVESPTKAKTIGKFLGKDYIVESSYGHVRDLPKSKKDAIDINGGFVPNYVIPDKKKEIVKKLMSVAKKADEVILATDEDREGESIAWHLTEALELNKTKSKVERIAFHEITEDAISDAIKSPRKINENLVSAQEARRVLDRLVGYDLSGLIWKKVRYGLSAGRVQSPALKIIVEREREIKNFKPVLYWTISAIFLHKNGELALVAKENPEMKERVDEIVSGAKNGKWLIHGVKETESRRNAPPPFITSTLQQRASTILGMSPSRTMRVAQRLYEAGHITYMRTDSTSLAMGAQKEILSLIKKDFGDEYAEAKIHKTKSKSAQEAHEAIRPTEIVEESAGKSNEERRLYELIRRRALSSQMAPAKLLRTKITAKSEDDDLPVFEATGSIITFDGWLAADSLSRGEDVEFPLVNKTDSLKIKSITPEEKETQPPPRYTEAGLVKELEKRGIGRPSTYATIVYTLLARGYVEKEGRSLRATDTGEVVSTFLENNFSEYVSDTFTAEIENELDEIANGKRKYLKTIKSFYGPFKKQVAEKDKTTEKLTNLGDAPKEMKCPKCGGKMVIKLAKNGKFLSCKRFPDCDGSRTFDGEEMKGPEETGENCPKCEKGKLVSRHGKYGKFIGCSLYPKCKFIKEDEAEKAARDTGVECPDCKKGTLGEKRGKYGPFFACSEYPDCRFTMKAKPTGEVCIECKSLMMQGTKTIPDRCSNRKCKMHNPHKLDNAK